MAETEAIKERAEAVDKPSLLAGNPSDYLGWVDKVVDSQQDVCALLAKVAAQAEQIELLGEALIDMVGQHTEALDDSYAVYGHSFMSADERAFDALVETGWAEHVSEGYSIRLLNEEEQHMGQAFWGGGAR